MPIESKYLYGLFSTRIGNHILFWTVITLVTAYQGSLFGGTFYDNFINMIAILPTQLLAAYLLVYFQIPKWLFKGKWLVFVISFLVFAYLIAILARILTIYIAEPIIGLEAIEESFWEIVTHPMYLAQVFVTVVYFPAILLFLIKMTKERFTHQNKVETLEKEKRTAELNFLKAQMNPHFLFNTLNNIYALAHNKSEDTPDMIMKLSEILDYTIYECNKPKVPIIKEWELIENYADLEAMRYSEKMDLTLNNQIDDEDCLIAPLILITVVENAFKYALGTKKAKVDISLSVVDNKLTFMVFNSKKTNALVKDKKGIGVKNINQQLSLIYPNEHEIKVNETSNTYLVTLKISL